jgi:hypothetical protein
VSVFASLHDKLDDAGDYQSFSLLLVRKALYSFNSVKVWKPIQLTLHSANLSLLTRYQTIRKAAILVIATGRIAITNLKFVRTTRWSFNLQHVSTSHKPFIFIAFSIISLYDARQQGNNVLTYFSPIDQEVSCHPVYRLQHMSQKN